LVKPCIIPASGSLQLIQSEIQSTTSFINIAILGAVKAAVIAIFDITAIKAEILRNYLITTKQFYIQFENKINYIDFLFNIFSKVLKAVLKFISNKI